MRMRSFRTRLRLDDHRSTASRAKTSASHICDAPTFPTPWHAHYLKSKTPPSYFRDPRHSNPFSKSVARSQPIRHRRCHPASSSTLPLRHITKYRRAHSLQPIRDSMARDRCPLMI